MHRIILFLFCFPLVLSAQNNITVTGKVFDAVSKQPLAYATIGVKGRPEQTATNEYGDFSLSLPPSYRNDSLAVNYIGYKFFVKRIADLEQQERIYLQEAYVLLDEVVITHKRLSLRQVDGKFRIIRGNLYAMETEVTNESYNLFLDHLEEYNKTALLKKCDYDLSHYSESEKEFFKRYAGEFQPKSRKKDTVNINYGRFPAVNVSHDAAVAYCEWLTDQYNTSNGKKKFKKVKFRLPTMQEWQIAALGYPKFQSWNLLENKVEVIVPKQDSVIELSKKGKRITIPVDEKEILYPWFQAYHYRKSPTNHHHCFLGNFKVAPSVIYKSCKSYFYAYDGWIRMSICAAYFPNDMGLYDVVGNVAEMIDEEGKALGGSWDDTPAESTIHSIKNYKHADSSIGFRVFMEVIEK